MLKLAYVGMSRPSHLLCVAIREEALEGHEVDLVDLGWDIVDVQAHEDIESRKTNNCVATLKPYISK